MIRMLNEAWPILFYSVLQKKVDKTVNEKRSVFNCAAQSELAVFGVDNSLVFQDSADLCETVRQEAKQMAFGQSQKRDFFCVLLVVGYGEGERAKDK